MVSAEVKLYRWDRGEFLNDFCRSYNKSNFLDSCAKETKSHFRGELSCFSLCFVLAHPFVVFALSKNGTYREILCRFIPVGKRRCLHTKR